MKTLIDYNDLAGFIRRLQFKILLTAQHERLSSYRKEVAHSADFSEALRSCIKVCLQEAVSNINGQKRLVSSSVEALPYDGQLHHRYNGFNDSDKSSELAKYFKKVNSQLLLNSIEDKLTKSAIDHVQASLRYARGGDQANSLMHAEIADASCEELSHFMRQEQYQGFVADLKDMLEHPQLLRH